MKKNIFFAIIFISMYINPLYVSGQGFVTLQGNEFRLNGSKFYPVAINYMVDLVYDQQGNYFVSPYWQYGPNNGGFENTTATGCYNQMVWDFQLLALMGFNSVRIVGALEFDKSGTHTGVPAFVAADVTCVHCQNPQTVLNQPPYTQMFGFIQTVLNAAATAGLKVQLLAGSGRIDDATFSNNYYVPYLQALATHFANNSTLYSYDFVNEPSFFANLPPKKGDVCSLVESWNNAIHNNSSYHLTTIGLIPFIGGISKWDPGFLKLDFLSYHLYPETSSSEPNTVQMAKDRVKSTIKWCSEVSTLPWMIGETSFAAKSDDNYTGDNGTRMEQASYAHETLNCVRDCGGIGYTWWNFQDMDWDGYYGLIDQNYLPKAFLVSEFQNFNPNAFGNTCTIPGNYFNYRNYSYFNKTGIVLDQNNNPIKNALINSWDPQWGNFAQTFTKSDGSFTLYSDHSIGFIEITAVRASVFPTTNANSITYPVILNQYQPVQNLTINNVNIANQTINYEAANSITSLNTSIFSGGVCEMKAGNTVYLQPGFSANLNSNYHAYASPVFANCNTVLTSHSRPNNGMDSVSNMTGVLATEFGSEDVLVYPNPANQMINLKYNLEKFKNCKIEVCDAFGRTVLQEENKTEIYVSNLSSGFYVLKFKSDEYEKTFKIVIQH